MAPLTIRQLLYAGHTTSLMGFQKQAAEGEIKQIEEPSIR
jgi:hypothetical protein